MIDCFGWLIDLIDLIIPYRFHCFSPISCSEEEEEKEEEEREAGDISIHEPSKQTSHRRSEQTERASEGTRDREGFRCFRRPSTGSFQLGLQVQIHNCNFLHFTSLHFTFCCIIFIFSHKVGPVSGSHCYAESGWIASWRYARRSQLEYPHSLTLRELT